MLIESFGVSEAEVPDNQVQPGVVRAEDIVLFLVPDINDAAVEWRQVIGRLWQPQDVVPAFIARSEGVSFRDNDSVFFHLDPGRLVL